MTLYSLLCQLMMHNSLLEQPMTIFTNTLKNIHVYSGQSHFYTSILCVHQMVECWQGVHSYKKTLPPMQTECITEGPWIATYTGSSLSVPSHFLSFPALLCTWRLSAADCITRTLPLGSWLGWASERHQQGTRGWAERSDGISFLLSSYFPVVFLALPCHNNSLHRVLVTLILTLAPSTLKV